MSTTPKINPTQVDNIILTSRAVDQWTKHHQRSQTLGKSGSRKRSKEQRTLQPSKVLPVIFEERFFIQESRFRTRRSHWFS